MFAQAKLSEIFQHGMLFVSSTCYYELKKIRNYLHGRNDVMANALELTWITHFVTVNGFATTLASATRQLQSSHNKMCC